MLTQLEIFRLHLEFRGRFKHAAAERRGTETIVVAAMLADGTTGYGEGLPREYVTGETPASVCQAIEQVLWPRLAQLNPRSFTALLEWLDQLPHRDPDGRLINCARCAVELALLDAYAQHFRTDWAMIPGWLGDAHLRGAPSLPRVRVSGVLDADNPRKLLRRMRLMRLCGLRDFKVKLGGPDDHHTLRRLHDRLASPLRLGTCTLRGDANGAWDIDAALAMAAVLPSYGITCLEQPLAAQDRRHLPALARLGRIDIMADEDLLTIDDARALTEPHLLVNYFNIRISKNGGLIPSLRLAAYGLSRGVNLCLGAMVGETGILAAAGIRFLQLVPDVRFTEIGYSTLLLRKDLTRPRLRFGWGGRLRNLHGPGLGVTVSRRHLHDFLIEPPGKLLTA